MGTQLTWIRITVMVFLLLTAADLALCDVLFPATCELESSGTEGGSRQTSSADGCFCCCTHVMPASVFRLEPNPEEMPAEPAPEVRQAAPPACSIFHPPKR